MYDFLDVCRAYKVSHAVCLGDVYDNSSPNTALRKIVVQWANEFESAKIKLHLIVGNHDVTSNAASPSALESLRVSLPFKYTHVYDRPTRLVLDDDIFYMLPFPSPALFASDKQYSDRLAEFPNDGIEAIAFSHLNVKGAKMGEQEFSYKGETHNLDASQTWRLAVNGHIHRPQRLKNGSIIIQGAAERLSFSEREEQRSFLILDTVYQTCKSVLRTNALKLIQFDPDVSLWNANHSPPTTEKIIKDYRDCVNGALVKISPFVDECSSINWGKVEGELLKAGAVRVFMGQAVFVNKKLNESKIKKLVQLEPYKAAKHYIFLRVKDNKERSALKRLFADVQRVT
jgi:DNA repair exonuclease SbcCD nuclease subunit